VHNGAMTRTSSRRARWLVPAAVGLGLVAAANLPNLLPAGADSPTLPALTPAELLAKAKAAKVSAVDGTIQITTKLGLPDLGSLTNGAPSSVTSLLAGVHKIDVAADGPERLRFTRSDPGVEGDWIRNGNDVWSWDSTTQTATHLALSPDGPDAAGGAHAPDGTKPEAEAGESADAGAPTDPVAAARELLAKVTPTTQVSVRSPRYVAGLAAYQLVLAPNDSASTVKEATISVDAATGVPLDVRVASKGTDPAFEVAFTKVSFATPPASRFSFTPPPGATVVQVKGPQDLLGTEGRHHGEAAKAPDSARPTAPDAQGAPGPGGHTRVVGSSWTSVAVITGQQIPAALGSLLRAAPTVPVGSGSARLVTTSLVNALVLDDGRIVVGAVTPAALQAAAVAP